MPFTDRSRLAVTLLVSWGAGTSLLACNAILGIDDHPFVPGGTDASVLDGASPDGSSGDGAVDGAGVGDGASDAGDGGVLEACSAEGATRCATGGAQTCTRGFWSAPAACAGSTQVCLAGACVACSPGALACTANNAPESCDDAGAWVVAAACGGSTPVCTNGACAKFRVTGGVRSTAPNPGTHQYRLTAGGFETGARSCTSAGVCVTGGIVP